MALDIKNQDHPSGSGKLVVVGTPIGNMGDISPRSVNALSQSNAILAEDTRITHKLLLNLKINKPVERCDENIIRKRLDNLLERIAQGEKLAYVSDAGMPGISDPGLVLIDACRNHGLPVEVIPGPTAVTTALVASGLQADSFYFAGFPPRKKGQFEEFITHIANIPGALIFYESPHRVQETLNRLANALPQRRAALCRELTKLHEEVTRDFLPALASEISKRETIKGEVVIVVEAPEKDELEQLQRAKQEISMEDFISSLQESGASKTTIAKEAAKQYGVSRQDIYDMLVNEQN